MTPDERIEQVVTKFFSKLPRKAFIGRHEIREALHVLLASGWIRPQESHESRSPDGDGHEPRQLAPCSSVLDIEPPRKDRGGSVVTAVPTAGSEPADSHTHSQVAGGIRPLDEQGGVMSLDDARGDVSVEQRRADLIRSAARGQGPTFIAAKLDMLIARVAQEAGGIRPEGAPGWQSMNTLPYERIDSAALAKTIRLFNGEQLLVLQPFGWHIDGHHIPNAAEQFSREGVCADHRWEIVCDYGPYVAVVKSLPTPPESAPRLEQE